MFISLNEGTLWTPNFKIAKDGSIIVNKGYFAGIINAQEGYIGGWNITDKAIFTDHNEYRAYI
jgi:hypothetical protein